MTSTSHPIRGYIGMVILDVHDHDDGAVLELGPPARLGRRLVLLEGCWTAVDISPRPELWVVGDDDQAQVDIGDDMYEQERYSEHDIDVVADEPVFPWKPEQ